MIKAILFDIDNVLYNSGHQVEMARRAAVEAMVRAGLGITIEEAFARLEDIVKKYGSNFGRHYDLLVGDQKDKSRIIAAGIVAYHNIKRTYLKPYDDALPTLSRLKTLGYKTGIVTDGLSVKQWEKLIRLGVEDMFDTVVISEDVGTEKPDPKIFRKACMDLGVNPDECLYVGDRLDTDILGANRSGMVSVRLLRGRYKEQKPTGLQDRPMYEIKRLSEVLEILKEL